MKAKDGRFTPSTLLSPEDLRHQTLVLREGLSFPPHLLIPPTLPSTYGSIEPGPISRRWRIQTSRVRGAEAFFPLSSRPSVRQILFAFHYGRKAVGRLRPFCSEPNCINPLHQEELMSISSDLCERFFQEALFTTSAGETFSLRLKSEGDAIRYRAALNRWRKENREKNLSLGLSFESLILRVQPEDPKAPMKAFLLTAETVEDDFEAALEEAVLQAQTTSRPKLSAADLARAELLGKNEEESE